MARMNTFIHFGFLILGWTPEAESLGEKINIVFHDLSFLSVCFLFVCFASFLYRIIEMPYAYQCCAFGVCENVYKISTPWNKGDNSSVDELHKKDAGLLQVQGKNCCCVRKL